MTWIRFSTTDFLVQVKLRGEIRQDTTTLMLSRFRGECTISGAAGKSTFEKIMSPANGLDLSSVQPGILLFLYAG
ncbi:hypothetical protein Acr_20g0003980 [Actinidia rufa]|uniref:Uncharacterized protein n=1 Tax=Actinidia rufa TaxID=165716 RepID=A0A7J0GCR5_9ERIC|nr:hypothetical protein Acr_20g0003980 [Actinidia rufa]